MSNRRPDPSAYVALLVFAAAHCLLFSPASAQSGNLVAGDSVRIDGSVVGSVLSVEGTRVTVLSRGEQRCRAGRMHGDAPICDPAPLSRQTVDLGEVALERRIQGEDLAVRTLVGGVLGIAAFGAAGYAIGPTVGFGRIDDCRNVGATGICPGEETLTVEQREVNALAREAKQRRIDQRRGALFFGAIGGTFTAIMARKLSGGWVRVQPSIPLESTDPWGVSFTVPGVR